MPTILPMNPLSDLSLRARYHGLKMSDVCAEAGIQPAQASRWKHGKVRPLYESVGRLEEALARLIERQALEAAQAADAPADAATPTESTPVGVLEQQIGAPQPD